MLFQPHEPFANISFQLPDKETKTIQFAAKIIWNNPFLIVLRSLVQDREGIIGTKDGMKSVKWGAWGSHLAHR